MHVFEKWFLPVLSWTVRSNGIQRGCWFCRITYRSWLSFRIKSKKKKIMNYQPLLETRLNSAFTSFGTQDGLTSCTQQWLNTSHIIWYLFLNQWSQSATNFQQVIAANMTIKWGLQQDGKKGIVIRNNKYAYNLQGKNHEKILHRIIIYFFHWQFSLNY